MFIQTKYSWMRDEDVINLAEGQSSDDLTKELAKRLSEYDHDDHDGCYTGDDMDEARREGKAKGKKQKADEIRGASFCLKNEIQERINKFEVFTLSETEKTELFSIIDKFVAGI
jgi:hypothetical protein